MPATDDDLEAAYLSGLLDAEGKYRAALDTVLVRDPDGEERILSIANAEAMGQRGEAIYCAGEDEGEPDHWHKHDRWLADHSIERDEEEMTDDEYIEQMDRFREMVEWQRGLIE